MINTKYFKLQPNYNSKTPIWLLILGILFFIFGLIIKIAFPEVLDGVQNNNPIDNMLSELPIVLVYILTGVLAPIIEELGFRGWQLRNKVFKLLAIGICFGFYYATFGFIIALLVELLMVFICFYKPSRQTRIIGVFITSLMFAVVHWNNYAIAEYRIMALISIMGIGLILSYITWRYSIIWAIVFHALYNAIAVQQYFTSPDSIEIKTETYHIVIEEKRNIENNSYMFKDSTIIVEDDLNSVINNWINTYFKDSTYFYVSLKNAPNVSVKATLSPTVDRKLLLDTLISTLGYKLDTTHIHKYYLVMPNDIDTPVVTLQNKGRYLYERLVYIGNTLRDTYNIPIFFDEKYNDRVVKIDGFRYNMTKEHVMSAFEKSKIVFQKDTISTLKGISLQPK